MTLLKRCCRMLCESEGIKMEMVLLAIAACIYCGTVFCVVGIWNGRQWERFRTNKSITEAVIVGYGHDDPAQWSTLMVRLPNTKWQASYKVNDTRIGSQEQWRYRAGQKISVYVMDHRIFGIQWPLLWLADRPLPDPKKKARPWFIMGAVCIGIAAIMFVVLIAGA